MRKLMEKYGKGGLLAALAVAVMSVGALAADGEASSTVDMTAITSGMTSGLTNISSSVMTMIGSVLPYALGVAGGILAITIGYKVFKRVTGK